MKDFNEVDAEMIEIKNKLGEWFFEDHDEVEDFNEVDAEMQEKMHELYCEDHDHYLLEYNYIVSSPVSELDYTRDVEEFVEDPTLFTYEDYLRTGEFGVWGDGFIK